MSISRAVLTICTVAALAHATSATAAPISMQFVSGATTVTVADGGVGDANPVDGAITFIGSIGSWNLNVGTGLGPNVLGPATMDLASVSTAFLGAIDPLTVSLTQTDIMSPAIGFLMDFGGTGLNLASAAYSAYADDANAAFGLSQLIGTLGPFGTNAFSGSTSGAVSVTGPYSLTQVLSLTGGRLGQLTMYSGDAQLSPIVRTDQVPEPMMLTLFGGGLATAGAWLRRRRAVRVS